MKNIIIIIIVVLSFSACKKEIVYVPTPTINLNNYVAVDVIKWHSLKAPIKTEYYLDYSDGHGLIAVTEKDIENWKTELNWKIGRTLFVPVVDYNIYNK